MNGDKKMKINFQFFAQNKYSHPDSFLMIGMCIKTGVVRVRLVLFDILLYLAYTFGKVRGMSFFVNTFVMLWRCLLTFPLLLCCVYTAWWWQVSGTGVFGHNISTCSKDQRLHSAAVSVRIFKASA